MAGGAGRPSRAVTDCRALRTGARWVGLALGFVWEWIRASAVRGEMVRHRQKVGHLERELTRLKGDAPADKDDVLALLDARKS